MSWTNCYLFCKIFKRRNYQSMLHWVVTWVALIMLLQFCWVKINSGSGSVLAYGYVKSSHPPLLILDNDNDYDDCMTTNLLGELQQGKFQQGDITITNKVLLLVLLRYLFKYYCQILKSVRSVFLRKAERGFSLLNQNLIKCVCPLPIVL